MRELIYYPGFEVQNLDWLKFALLYIDELNPIIPKSGDRHLTNLSRKLTNETDLIRAHRPDYEEGEKATLDAIDVVEKILRQPQAYSRIFWNNNMVDNWRRPENHNYTLFKDKYTYTWELFCQNNGLATSTPEGIGIPKELGFIYMTLLAQIIADSRGISPITDHARLDRFSIFTRRAGYPERKKLKVAQAVLQLRLPENLNHIKLDEIIKFRNRPGFKNRLNAFHTELDKFFNDIENGSSPERFVNSFNNVWQDFCGDIATLGLGAMSFGLGTWILINSPQTTTEAYLKELVIGGASLAVGSVIGFRNTWKNSQTRWYTRKYLANLSQLKPVRVHQNIK